MKKFVIDVLGGGVVFVEKETKQEVIQWFFENYPYNNFTDMREVRGEAK